MTSDKAIVLHKFPYKSGFIVELFSEIHGKFSIILPSRKSKANPIGNFQSFTLISCLYNWKEHTDLQYLKSSTIASLNTQAQIDPIKNCVQLFLADFLREVLISKISTPELFILFEHIVELINHSTSSEIKDIPCYALYKTATILGFHIENQNSMYFNIKSGRLTNSLDLSQKQLQPEHLKYLKHIEGIVFATEKDYISDYNTRSETFDSLYRYFCFHLNHFKALKSFDVLKQIMT